MKRHHTLWLLLSVAAALLLLIVFLNTGMGKEHYSQPLMDKVVKNPKDNKYYELVDKVWPVSTELKDQLVGTAYANYTGAFTFWNKFLNEVGHNQYFHLYNSWKHRDITFQNWVIGHLTGTFTYDQAKLGLTGLKTLIDDAYKSRQQMDKLTITKIKEYGPFPIPPEKQSDFFALYGYAILDHQLLYRYPESYRNGAVATGNRTFILDQTWYGWSYLPDRMNALSVAFDKTRTDPLDGRENPSHCMHLMYEGDKCMYKSYAYGDEKYIPRADGHPAYIPNIYALCRFYLDTGMKINNLAEVAVVYKKYHDEYHYKLLHNTSSNTNLLYLKYPFADKALVDSWTPTTTTTTTTTTKAPTPTGSLTGNATTPGLATVTNYSQTELDSTKVNVTNVTDKSFNIEITPPSTSYKAENYSFSGSITDDNISYITVFQKKYTGGVQNVALPNDLPSSKDFLLEVSYSFDRDNFRNATRQTIKRNKGSLVGNVPEGAASQTTPDVKNAKIKADTITGDGFNIVLKDVFELGSNTVTAKWKVVGESQPKGSGVMTKTQYGDYVYRITGGLRPNTSYELSVEVSNVDSKNIPTTTIKTLALPERKDPTSYQVCRSSAGHLVGKTDEESDLRLYTKDECLDLGGTFSGVKKNNRGECIRNEGGSFSFECRNEPDPSNTTSFTNSDADPFGTGLNTLLDFIGGRKRFEKTYQGEIDPFTDSFEDLAIYNVGTETDQSGKIKPNAGTFIKITPDNDISMSTTATTGTTFKAKIKNGKISFITQYGKYISSSSDNSMNGQINANGIVLTNWEQFTLKRTNTGTFTIRTQGGKYFTPDRKGIVAQHTRALNTDQFVFISNPALNIDTEGNLILAPKQNKETQVQDDQTFKFNPKDSVSGPTTKNTDFAGQVTTPSSPMAIWNQRLNKFLSARIDGSIMLEPKCNKNEIFESVLVSNGKYAIKSSSGKYLSVRANGDCFADAVSITFRELFIPFLSPIYQNQVCFKAANDKYISIDATQLKADALNPSMNTSFVLIKDPTQNIVQGQVKALSKEQSETQAQAQAQSQAQAQAQAQSQSQAQAQAQAQAQGQGQGGTVLPPKPSDWPSDCPWPLPSKEKPACWPANRTWPPPTPPLWPASVPFPPVSDNATVSQKKNVVYNIFNGGWGSYEGNWSPYQSSSQKQPSYGASTTCPFMNSCPMMQSQPSLCSSMACPSNRGGGVNPVNTDNMYESNDKYVLKSSIVPIIPLQKKIESTSPGDLDNFYPRKL